MRESDYNRDAMLATSGAGLIAWEVQLQPNDVTHVTPSLSMCSYAHPWDCEIDFGLCLSHLYLAASLR